MRSVKTSKNRLALAKVISSGVKHSKMMKIRSGPKRVYWAKLDNHLRSRLS